MIRRDALACAIQWVALWRGLLCGWRGAICLSLAGLYACTTLPEHTLKNMSIQGQVLPDSGLSPARIAQVYADAGRWMDAAQAFLTAAEADDPAAALRHQLNAARAYANAKAFAAAHQVLSQVSIAGRSPSERIELALLNAELALRQGDAPGALNALPTHIQDISNAQRATLHLLRARAYAAMGWMEAMISARIEADPWLANAHARRENHTRIWDALHALPMRQLEIPPDSASPAALGWWALALSARRNDRYALQHWARTYPDHPALHSILPQVLEQTPTPAGIPMPVVYQVALLAPLSGPYQGAGQVLRHGFEAAAAGVTTAYRIYDTAGDPARIVSLYQQAVAEGAGIIIGPLLKEELAALVHTALTVPVIALNSVPDGAPIPDGLIQFTLAPEAEAQQAAQQALQSGHHRAAVIAADDALGRRLSRAFSAYFEAGGGQVEALRQVPPNSNDLGVEVKALLAPHGAAPLWQDQAMHNRRIDLIFIAAAPRDARLIRPLLKFHDAASLPVYTTARVYTEPDPVMDRDLDGVIFCDMPYVFDQTPKALSGNLMAIHLEALGRDALTVARSLPDLSTGSIMPLPGLTGRLHLRGGRIIRELDCAAFHAGQPQRLPEIANIVR